MEIDRSVNKKAFQSNANCLPPDSAGYTVNFSEEPCTRVRRTVVLINNGNRKVNKKAFQSHANFLLVDSMGYTVNKFEHFQVVLRRRRR